MGQGLAGAALAWTAHLRGLSVHLVDRGEEVTSSRVAAGLMMPITGKRLAKSWEWDSFWPVAVAFYHSIERMTGTSCLQIGPALRILQTEREVEPHKMALVRWSHIEQPNDGRARFCCLERAEFRNQIEINRG